MHYGICSQCLLFKCQDTLCTLGYIYLISGYSVLWNIYLLCYFLKEAMKYEVTYILHYTLNLQVLEKCPDKEEMAISPPKRKAIRTCLFCPLWSIRTQRILD